jgi:hypothetical protein
LFLLLASMLPVLACSAAAMAAGNPASHYQPVTRDQRVVAVNGKPELWRLQWRTQPAEDCPVGDIGWATCPCIGFEFGETGPLELLRIVDGKTIDRLDLTPLFSNEDNGPDSDARLRRWPMIEGDRDETFRIDGLEAGGAAASRAFVNKVHARADVPVLEVADYDRDGWATEFILQTAALPCGKKQSILVGVSKNQPRLHAFGTAEHPRRPLELYVRQWEELRTAKLPLQLDMWSCGDHGSERQSNMTVSIDARGMHALREQLGCPDSPQNGRVLEHEIL